MVWPLIRVCVRLGLVPRMLTRLFSEKPPSPPADDEMFTPGTRCTASATFLSGSLPMSSALTTSMTESLLRFWLSDCSSDARIPVTTTACMEGSVAAACCACAAMLKDNKATAAATGRKVVRKTDGEGKTACKRLFISSSIYRYTAGGGVFYMSTEGKQRGTTVRQAPANKWSAKKRQAT